MPRRMPVAPRVKNVISLDNSAAEDDIDEFLFGSEDTEWEEGKDDYAEEKSFKRTFPENAELLWNNVFFCLLDTQRTHLLCCYPDCCAWISVKYRFTSMKIMLYDQKVLLIIYTPTTKFNSQSYVLNRILISLQLNCNIRSVLFTFLYKWRICMTVVYHVSGSEAEECYQSFDAQHSTPEKAASQV